MTNRVHCQGESSFNAVRFSRNQLDNEVSSPGKGRKMVGILRASLCGLLACLTLHGCCFGCGGSFHAHTGMVKYDDFDYTDLSPGAQKMVNAGEFADALMLGTCVPLACCCCLGCCGAVGPVGLARGKCF